MNKYIQTIIDSSCVKSVEKYNYSSSLKQNSSGIFGSTSTPTMMTTTTKTTAGGDNSPGPPRLIKVFGTIYCQKCQMNFCFCASSVEIHELQSNTLQRMELLCNETIPESV